MRLSTMERVGFSSFGTHSRAATSGVRPRDRLPGFAIAVALHVAVGAWLLQFDAVRRPLAEVAPIMVRLIAPPKVEVAPPPEPPKPKPLIKPQPVRKPVEPAPIVTTPSEAPSAFVAPSPPPPPPAPPIEVAASPAPPPIVPPRFSADYLQNPAPPYPPLARRMGEQGRVVLRVLVSPAGLPEQVELKSSSGSPRLDQSALDTVKHWKFIPARQGEQPVPAWVLVPISFTLQG
jgi:protein TonB